ncbi:jg3701 [Pararge aegeria aegeria]|uniref:Jg3701 protein n=1 Tax=Pararge aegeria aegeria TaxID=348720 RepID=A0A8S4S7C3_9NEOP|nr:jg3701 [Pararge aegeria aegeria]
MGRSACHRCDGQEWPNGHDQASEGRPPARWTDDIKRVTGNLCTLGDLGGLLSFWSELGWLESPSGELYQWHYVQRKVPADQVRRQAQRKKKKTCKHSFRSTED